MARAHVIFEDNAPADTPILRHRADYDFTLLRRYEYAYIAHRFPYVAELILAYEARITQADTAGLLTILKEEYELPHFIDVRFCGRLYPGRAWPNYFRIMLPRAGPCLTVGLVVHEFAHLISGGDYHGKWNNKTFHGPSFVLAMIDVFDRVRGLTGAF